MGAFRNRENLNATKTALLFKSCQISPTGDVSAIDFHLYL